MFGNSIAALYSALISDNKALQIRNRNIANVDNPDYVKEEPILDNFAPFGGVKVSDVKRLSDEILHRQMLDSYTRYKGYDEQKKILESINVYFDETQTNNVQGFINKFFESLHNFLREPDNEAAKEELLERANTLVGALQDRYQKLEDIKKTTLSKFNSSLETVNRVSKQLGELNGEILKAYAKTKGQGNDYKALLDQRDKLLKRLSEFVNADFKYDKIGRVEVNIKEPQSTAGGFIKLVSYNGETNNLTFDSLNQQVIDSQGIRWPLSFFKTGILGAYSQTVQVTTNLQQKLDNIATSLTQNVTLENGTKAVFEITDPNYPTQTLKVKITKTDLDNYDKTQADTDAKNADTAWKTITDTYKDLTGYLSTVMSDIKIKYETERDLYNSLQEKYTARVGVNLDEELAEVMKLQQHYQAVSKMIATSTRLVDYILNAIR